MSNSEKAVAAKKRFLGSWFAVCLVWLVGNVVIQAISDVTGSSSTTDMIRPTAAQPAMLFLMLIAHVLMAGAFVWVYQIRRNSQPWPQQGLKFGLVIALLVPINIYIFSYVTQQTPDAAAILRVFLECVVVVASALLVAFLHREPLT